MFKRIMQIGIALAVVVMVACLAVQFLGALAKL